jgi:hypothetical protein
MHANLSVFVLASSYHTQVIGLPSIRVKFHTLYPSNPLYRLGLNLVNMNTLLRGRFYATALKIGIAVGILSAPIVYYTLTLRRLKSRLASHIPLISNTGNPDVLKILSKYLESLPSDVLENESEYFTFQEQASKSVPLSSLPKWKTQELLIAYLRHNFVKFVGLPQSYIMRLVLDPVTKESWNVDYISELDFEEDDLVCGGYYVMSRSSNKVEFGMGLANMGDRGPVGGRLVISIDEDVEGDQAKFVTQLLMWRKSNSKETMTMESSVARWAHELTSMWLLDVGTKYLIDLGRQEEVRPTAANVEDKQGGASHL